MAVAGIALHSIRTMKFRSLRYYLVRCSLSWKLWHWLSILKYTVFAKVEPVANLMEKGLMWIERESLAIARDFKPMTCGTPGHEVEVHTLLCHAHVEMYLWAIFTFQHFVGVALPIVVHDDGSLTEADRQLLEARIRGI